MRARSLDTGVRLRRLRWRLTGFFTLATALCLAALALVAVGIDDGSRRRALDDELTRRVTGLSRAVWIDAGKLHLEPLGEDTLAQAPGGLVVVTVTSGRGTAQRWAGGTATLRPRTADALALATTVTGAEDVEVSRGRTPAGLPVHLAGAPVWGAREVEAVVIASADPAPSQAAHQVLVRWLLGGCLALVAAAGLVGHLISGRSIRPAARTLERQERFLADASHEIRTPLATLRLAIENGLRDPARSPEALQDALRLSDDLGRLVSALLARARVQGGTQEVERIPVRLDLLVEQVVADLPTAGARVDVAGWPVVVRADPDLLTLAVRNLLVNALQHGSGRPVDDEGDGADVEVVVHAGVVSVRDHGPGIPAAARRAVLRRGVTGAPRTGSGIGLAIVEWVARLHGGAVRIGAAPGGGTLAELDLAPAVLHDPLTVAAPE